MTLIFAALAVVWAGRTFRIESKRDELNEEARKKQDLFLRRAQAALISAWWDGTHSPASARGAFVRNASDAPAYHGYLTFTHVNADMTGSSKLDLEVIAPTTTPSFHQLPAQPSIVGDYRVQMTFTDASGIRWMRGPHGRLQELQPQLIALMEPPMTEAFKQFARDFQSAYGVEVTFRTTEQSAHLKSFLRNADRDEIGADVLVCPHDWIGDLTQRDLIEPIVLSVKQLEVVDPVALAAFTVNGQLYGIPSHMDTMALMRNTDLAPDLPATFDDLIDHGTAMVSSGQVDHAFTVGVGGGTDMYQIWPLVASGGGWLFGRTSAGEWDYSRVGIGSPESIEALKRIRKLGLAGAGILRPDIDIARAKEIFRRRRTPYTLGTSGSVRVFRDAGVPFEVSEIPPWRGGVGAQPLSGTWGFVVIKGSAKREIAQDLIGDYLARDDVAGALSKATGSPSVLREATDADPAVRSFRQQCHRSVPMPACPEMSAVFRLLAAAELDLVRGMDAAAVGHWLADEIANVLGGRDTDR